MMPSTPSRDRAPGSGLLAILAAIIPVTITGTPITVQPGMVQGMVDYMGLPSVQAGFVASAEVTGLMVATVVFAFVGNRLNWRLAYPLGLAIVVLGNLLSLAAGNGAAFTVLRAITGIGAGLATAIGFAALGNTQDAPRNYGWAVATIIGYSGMVLWALPALFDLGGYQAFMIAYAIVTALCLPLVPFLPLTMSDLDPVAHETMRRDIRARSAGILAVLSVFIFFVGYAAAWTYMALLGRNAGIDEVSVSHALSVSQFAGVAGALAIVIQSGRVHDMVQVWVMLAIGAAAIFAFTLPQSPAMFLALNCIFQFAWNAGQPLLLGIVASRDASGRLLRFAIPMQYVGLASGPAFAAYQLGLHDNYSGVMIGAGVIAALTPLAITPIIAVRRRRLVAAMPL